MPDNVIDFVSRERRRPAKRKQPTVPRGTPMRALIPSWELALRAANKAPTTIEAYLRVAYRFAGFLEDQAAVDDAERVAADEVRAFLVHERERAGLPTAAAAHSYLGVWFSWIIAEDERSTFSPVLKADRPRVPRKARKYLTLEEIGRLLEVCKGRDFASRRDTAIILTLIDNGMRVSGIAGLRLDDVDLRGKRLCITEKGGDEHWAPIGNTTAQSSASSASARRRPRPAWATSTPARTSLTPAPAWSTSTTTSASPAHGTTGPNPASTACTSRWPERWPCSTPASWSGWSAPGAAAVRPRHPPAAHTPGAWSTFPAARSPSSATASVSRPSARWARGGRATLLADIGMGTVGETRARCRDGPRTCQDDYLMNLVSLAATAEPDAFARILGAAGILIAAGSFFVAWLAFKRGGYKIKVSATATTETLEDYPHGSRRMTYVNVIVSNHRAGEVQVVRFHGDDGLNPPREIGLIGDTQHTLKGISQAKWRTHGVESPAHPAHGGRCRIGVELANGRIVWSNWMTMGSEATKQVLTSRY
ncbi:tyrosine-type recombinase/integrase [Nonomuraea sediminis]|uniref:tyrosine-type recombinase/integrase n=1 Tax=Nonomuraea sediminis TaxID=2835864 RepID=UPI001BDD546C|nr:tyrosine-type recombinase/integrase [Nonomuraea sediminis]